MSESAAVFATVTYRLPDGRALAYADTGPAHAEDVLVCLPGLLETRQTFVPVLQAHLNAGASCGLRVLSVDLCGRGDSDPLPGDQGYTMAGYLDDVTHWLQHQVLAQGAKRLHVLGTSMGGILGMYLAANRALPVHTLILNDVGLSFYWVSIYGLYDGMKKSTGALLPDDLAAELNVTLGAMLAVQSPSHFDLPYRRDWKGMKFGHLLQHYSGAVRLVHGADSGVCLSDQVRELREQFAYARVLEVPGAKHPAPFTPAVCAFVLADLAPEPEVKVLDVSSAAAQAVATEAQAVAPQAQAAPKPSTLHAQPTPVPRPTQDEVSGVWSWLKRKLGGRE